MEENKNNSEETQIVPVEEMALEDMQLTEQLYNSAGLDPVVDAGLKDYDEKIQGENRLLSKFLGPRASDIRGYGESVARRVAYAVYALMNRQYGGKVGDLRSHIMALQDERDRANTRYDDLMGRVVGMLGEEYKDLRSDSKIFMEKLTTVLGEEIKDSKIDHKALAEKLADIDGLRNQVVALAKEKERIKAQYESQLEKQKETHETKLVEQKKGTDSVVEDQKKDYESRLAEQGKNYETRIQDQRESYEFRLEELKKSSEASLEKQRESYETRLEKQQIKYETGAEKLTDKHERAVSELKTRIAGLENNVKELESANGKLTAELAALKDDHTRLEAAMTGFKELVSLDEMGKELGDELHTYILDDSKVPDMVIDGVGKFIDFRKYLGMAAIKGAEKVLKEADKSFKDAMKKKNA